MPRSQFELQPEDPYRGVRPWPHPDIYVEFMPALPTKLYSKKHRYRLWIIDGDEFDPYRDWLVGEFTFAPSRTLDDAYEIIAAFLYDKDEETLSRKPDLYGGKYKGWGLAQDMYFKIMQEFGPLHPDWTVGVSKLGLNPWIRFSLDPDVEKTCYPAKVIDLNEDGEPLVAIDTGEKVATVTFPDGWEGILNCVYSLRD